MKEADVRDLVTTLLDAAALVMIAAGVTGGLWLLIGPWSLTVGGVVLLISSLLAAASGAAGDDE